ncbi:MAG: alternative ribosome rescue aminoacyl-tRNA hydrolase ArfB [Microthrixaceae bacterium]
MERTIRVGHGLEIPPHVMEWRFSGSGGPGGQHANTANTRVELVLDLTACTSLPDWARARLRARLGDEVRVVSSEQRSQWQNRRVALDRMEALLCAAMDTPRRRVPTRPTRGSVQRRLEAKARTSRRKKDRRRPFGEE